MWCLGIMRRWRVIWQTSRISGETRSRGMQRRKRSNRDRETTGMSADTSPTASTRKAGSSTSRARKLADRIEEGATALAAFAEKLSDAEWQSPGSNSGTDRRTVGVIVHHV